MVHVGWGKWMAYIFSEINKRALLTWLSLLYFNIISIKDKIEREEDVCGVCMYERIAIHIRYGKVANEIV